MNHHFLTHLSVEECQRRLLELRAGPRLVEAMPDQTENGGIFGKIEGGVFHLYARRAMAINSFRRLFYGHLKATPDGTLIEGEFRVALRVRIFAAGFSIFSGLFFLFLLFTATTSPSQANWFGVAIPALMLLGMVSMYFLGQKLGAAEEEDVLSFVRERLVTSKPAA